MEVVPYVFGFMALAIAGWVAKSIENMSHAIEEMKNSVAELNKIMAVSGYRLDDHDKRLNRLEEQGE